MAPPELARDAPVLDVAHPVEVRLRPVLGDEADAAGFDGRDRRLGERLDLHEPLVGEIAARRRCCERSPRGTVSVCVSICARAGRAASSSATTPCAPRSDRARVSAPAVVVQRRRRREDVDLRQAVALADLEVVEVVRRRDLHAAGAELRIDELVGDDRDRAVRRTAARRSCRSGAGSARRRDAPRPRCRRAWSRGASSRRRGDPSPSVDRIARSARARRLLRSRLDLEVGERGVQHRVPVDQALAAVDQAFVVQAHEHFA